MYKKLLLVVCALATLVNLRAQSTPFEHQKEGIVAFGLGFKGGVSISMPDVDEWSDQTVSNQGVHSVVGAQFGVVGMLPLNKSWAIRPELAYSSQGFRETESNGTTFSERTVRHRYLQVPLLVQVAAGRNLCLYTGPKAGYLVGKSEGFKRGDLAWDLGFSTLNIWNFGLDVRMSWGLLNIAPENHPAIARARNQVFQAGLIYMFTAKK